MNRMDVQKEPCARGGAERHEHLEERGRVQRKQDEMESKSELLG